MIVIIPSCRSVSFSHLAPLIDAGARFIVVDDSSGTIRMDHPAFSVYSWADQDRLLGAHRRAIPRGNGACRDFGFWIAWRESDAGEVVVALDDDCVVYHQDFARRVTDSLSDRPRPVATGAGRYFNVIDCYEGVAPHVFPRGFPYSARADYEPWGAGKIAEEPPAFNLGLWRGVFDVNAVDKLGDRAYTYDEARLRHDSVVVPDGALISACSMNMHFRREVIPALYQFLMPVEVAPGWSVDRYGDIWGGFVLKTLMDIRGDRMSVGEPMIDHRKDGNYLRNIRQEHVAHLVNDEFVAILDRARATVRSADYVTMMGALTEVFAEAAPSASPLLRAYLDVQVPALRSWVEILG